MQIKTANKCVIIIFSFFAVFTLFSIVLATHYRNEQLDMFIVQQQALIQARQLATASDHLTNAVRAFAATGEVQYSEDYAKEVTIDHNRENAVASLKALGTPANELELIEKAKRNSDDLMHLENEAFAEGRSGNLEKARQLVYGQTYQDLKAKITKPIQQFQQQMAERLVNEVQQARWRANTSMIVALVMVGITVVMSVLVQVLFYGRKVVMPLVLLNDCVERLTIGTENAELECFNDGSEIATLAKSIKNYHHLALQTNQLRLQRQRIAEIAMELHKAQSVHELAQIFMGEMSVLLAIRHGLLYVADTARQRLQLVGGYGVSILDIGKEVPFGEGLSGQCAVNKTPVFLDQPPANYVKVISGTGNATPVCIVFRPLILNTRLVGVLELAALQKFSDNDLQVLTELELNLAMSLEILGNKKTDFLVSVQSPS